MEGPDSSAAPAPSAPAAGPRDDDAVTFELLAGRYNFERTAVRPADHRIVEGQRHPRRGRLDRHRQRSGGDPRVGVDAPDPKAPAERVVAELVAVDAPDDLETTEALMEVVDVTFGI